jgi:hypothetical protein
MPTLSPPLHLLVSPAQLVPSCQKPGDSPSRPNFSQHMVQYETPSWSAGTLLSGRFCPKLRDIFVRHQYGQVREKAEARDCLRTRDVVTSIFWALNRCSKAGPGCSSMAASLWHQLAAAAGGWLIRAYAPWIDDRLLGQGLEVADSCDTDDRSRSGCLLVRMRGGALSRC